MAECITADLKTDVKKEMIAMNELDFETFEPREDKKASIRQVTKLQKIRQLDRSIGDSLKRLYDFRCQMTGEGRRILWCISDRGSSYHSFY